MVRRREPRHAENFDTDSFTVDEGGTGHFFSVAQACDFARDAFDVVNNAVTVFIRNGLYDHEAPKNVAMGYPYAIINKGANRISLIGESRDGVIVSYENNSVNRAKIIEAGGECTVANMTVNCLNDEVIRTPAPAVTKPATAYMSIRSLPHLSDISRRFGTANSSVRAIHPSARALPTTRPFG